MKPKKYLGSGPDVWTSNLLWLCHQYPNHFEMESKEASKYSMKLRSMCSSMKDIRFYFTDTITKDDILALCRSSQDSEFRRYECNKLKWLRMRLEKIDWSVEENNEDEKLLIADLVVLKEKLTEIAEELDFTIRQSSDLELNNIELAYKTIWNQCQDIIEFIKSKKFSSIYPYLSEYTDAGPGVGVSNIET